MKKVYTSLCCCLSIFLLTFLLASCSQEYQADFFAMDTVMNIRIQGNVSQNTLDETQQVIHNLDSLLSKTNEASEVFQLNESSTTKTSQLSKDTLDLLNLAQKYAIETQGAFDFSLGRLSDLWGFSSDTPAVPTQEEIARVKSQSGYKSVLLNHNMVSLEHGVHLDFGGIAKGYATDKVVSFLQEKNVKSALLSLGGNIYALGQNNGKNWKVGIANPKNPEELIGYLSVTDTAVITSGDYQRYFEQDSKRYHHILDRTSGYPADSDILSVTVVSSDATKADAYSTALFVMGYEKALETVNQHDDMDAIFVLSNGSIHVTDKLKNQFVSQ